MLFFSNEMLQSFFFLCTFLLYIDCTLQNHSSHVKLSVLNNEMITHTGQHPTSLTNLAGRKKISLKRQQFKSEMIIRFHIGREMCVLSGLSG